MCSSPAVPDVGRPFRGGGAVARPGAVAATALLLLVGGLTGCSTSGDPGARDRSGRDPGATTADRGTTRPEPDGDEPAGPGGTLPTAPPRGGGSTADDVADETFDGLGDPRIDVASYDVTLRADVDVEEVRGRVTIELTPVGQVPLDSFTLDLRGPKVTEATVGAKPAKVTAVGAELTIEPADPLPPGQRTEVVLSYRGTPEPTTFPGLGVPVGWQPDDAGGWFTMSEPDGTSTWVPVSDHPSDKAAWTITLDTAKGVTGVASGRLVSRREDGSRVRWRWQESEPVAPHLVLAAVGHYDLVQRKGPGATKVVLAFPPDLPEAHRRAFDELDDMLSFFASRFGGYPDDDAGAIVVDKELGLALETQTRPLFGTDAFLGGARTFALAHELGHQWFGDLVTVERWPDLWLAEGFATYADLLYRDHLGDIDLDEHMADLADRFQGIASTVRDPRVAGKFAQVVYQRGALTLHALRKTVGDDDFFAILEAWTSGHGGRSASTADFVATAEDVSGKELSAFFTSWLDETPQPDLPA